MKRILIPLILILATESRAFILVSPTGRFSKPGSVKINVADDSCATAGITHGQILVLAQKAVDKWWNRVPTSALHIETGGIISAGPDDENTITIVCAASGDFSASDRYPEATATFSEHPSGGGVGYVFINNVFPGGWSDPDSRRLLFVMGHELGHALNSDHSDDPASIMTYNTSDSSLGSYFLEHLSQDDVDGITYLYPIESQLGGFFGRLRDSGSL